MENFNFGEIPVRINNNYSDIEKARKSSDTHPSKKIVADSVQCLSSLYKEASKVLSPENRSKLNKLLIGLAITLLSSDMNNHVFEKEPEIETTPDTNHSFKLEAAPQSDIKMEILPPAEHESGSELIEDFHHFPKAENLPPTITHSQENSPIIIKESKSKIIKEQLPKDSQKENVSERVQNIVDEIQVIAAVLTKNEKLYPREMFTEELSIAQKIVESGLRVDAHSKKDSVGETQVQPITMKECIRYANILSRAGDIQTSLPDEKNITEKDISEMITLVKSNGDYADAFKDIYLIDLLNNHGIGRKEFDRGDIDGALGKILPAYNWNPNDFKKYENQKSVWPKESQNYPKKIFHCMKIINRIKIRMAGMNMLTGIYDLSPILTLEINKYERELSREDPGFDETIGKIMQGYLDVISEMEKIKEKPLAPAEIKRLIDKFNPNVYRDYKNYLAKIN